MKKALAPLIVLFALMFGSLGSAQSYFGLYTSTYALIGLQNTTGPLRLGVGIDPFWYGFGIVGSADFTLGRFDFAPTSDFIAELYYGAGVNAGFYFSGSYFGSSGGGLIADAHGLFGIEYKLPASSYSVYGEIQAGLRITPFTGFYGGGRFGVNFR